MLDALVNRLNRFLKDNLAKDFCLYASKAHSVTIDRLDGLELQVNVKDSDVAAVERRLRGEVRRFLKQLDEKSWQRAIQALVVDCEMATDDGQALAEGCSGRLDRWGKLITPADDIRLYRRLKLAAAKKLLKRLTTTRPNVLIVYDDAPAP